MLYSVILVLMSVSYVTPERIFVSVDPQLLPGVFNIFMACIDKTGIDSKTMQKIIDWKFEDNDATKKYMYCFAKNSGFGDRNGYLVKDKIVKALGNHPLRRELVDAIDACNKLRGNNKYDTIYKTATCFRDTSPVLVKV